MPGRERTFFVNKELTKIDDMLAGVMRYKQGAPRRYHLHENCEHFYFIMEGKGSVETPEEASATWARATWSSFRRRQSIACEPPRSPLFYFEFQAPNRFVTTILDGTPDDLQAGIAWTAASGFKPKSRMAEENLC